MNDLHRRGLLTGTVGMGLGLTATAAWPHSNPSGPSGTSGRLLNAADHGIVGDGHADDTDALQRALDAAIAERGGGVLLIPPGTYRVTRTLRIETPDRPEGDITHGCVVRAHGARLVSAISHSQPVVEIISHAIVRFLTIEGLEIQGSGKDGHGLSLTCIERGRYIYNFCLRDVIVQNCGGDGCRMTGNLFEGQVFNSYFRDNGGNGATLSHGPEDTVLSAIHAFGCVFGGNGVHGVEMREGAQDAGFQGCYFLLNGKFGLSAPDGCTLLSHCGFENNHRSAESFEKGDAGIRLMVRGTLIGCTAYSIKHQTHLIRAYLTDKLVMVGCTGGGTGKADGAGLAKLKGDKNAQAFVVGAQGRIDDDGGVEIVNVGPAAAGRFPSNWDSPNLAQLGDYRLWVDADGQLRMKSGSPASDDDGSVVGT